MKHVYWKIDANSGVASVCSVCQLQKWYSATEKPFWVWAGVNWIYQVEPVCPGILINGDDALSELVRTLLNDMVEPEHAVLLGRLTLEEYE